MEKTKQVIIFGGSGFIGSYIVKNLLKSGYIVKVFSRNNKKISNLKPLANIGQLKFVSGDINNLKTIEEHINGCDVVINLIGILNQTKRETYENAHVKIPKNIATAVKNCGNRLMIHFSAMGIENVPSQYAKSKIEGEKAVLKILPNAIIVKPSLVFGPEDNFFNKFAKLATILPFLPLFVHGKTEFQPIYVDDIAEFISVIISKPLHKNIFLIGGAKIYNMKSLLKFILSVTNRNNFLINIPFSIAKIFAFFLELKFFSFILKPLTGSIDPLLTREQLNFMRFTKISKSYDLENIGIKPVSIENIVTDYLRIYKKF